MCRYCNLNSDSHRCRTLQNHPLLREAVSRGPKLTGAPAPGYGKELSGRFPPPLSLEPTVKKGSDAEECHRNCLTSTQLNVQQAKNGSTRLRAISADPSTGSYWCTGRCNNVARLRETTAWRSDRCRRKTRGFNCRAAHCRDMGLATVWRGNGWGRDQLRFSCGGRLQGRWCAKIAGPLGRRSGLRRMSKKANARMIRGQYIDQKVWWERRRRCI